MTGPAGVPGPPGERGERGPPGAVLTVDGEVTVVKVSRCRLTEAKKEFTKW